MRTTSINKVLILVTYCFLLSACDEEVVTTIPAESNTCSETTPIEPEPPVCTPSQTFSFDGIDSIDVLSQRELKLNWTKISEASTYIIFEIVDGARKYKATAGKSANSYTIKNLQAATTYKFAIKAMDKTGQIENNEHSIEATTLPWPIFTNDKSLTFTNAQTIETAPGNAVFNHSSGRFAISLWFKTSTSQNDKRLVNFYNVSNNTAANIHFTTNAIGIGYRDLSNNYKTLLFTTSYADNSWHHVVGMYNGTKFSLYYDGALVSSTIDSFIGFSSKKGLIGGFGPSSNNFTGLMDEVSFWNSALSKADIQKIYNNGSAFDLKQHPRHSAIKGWYRLGDNLSDTVSLLKDELENNDGLGNGFIPGDFSSDTP